MKDRAQLSTCFCKGNCVEGVGEISALVRQVCGAGGWHRMCGEYYVWRILCVASMQMYSRHSTSHLGSSRLSPQLLRAMAWHSNEITMVAPAQVVDVTPGSVVVEFLVHPSARAGDNRNVACLLKMLSLRPSKRQCKFAFGLMVILTPTGFPDANRQPSC